VSGAIQVRRLQTFGEHEIQGLSDVLIDCVEGGASVSFMLPMSRAKAEAFWHGASASAARGERLVLAAEDAAGTIVGTVQILLNQPENQPHRGDLAKMLVHRRVRRQGVGAALLAAAERSALEAGKTLLVLDTVTGSAAERLYTRQGWQRCGEIPSYALWPDGRPCPTTFFYKFVGGSVTAVDQGSFAGDAGATGGPDPPSAPLRASLPARCRG
jgi:GNAT superfamily N-acetyltransferase